ncbi:MAG TPA: ATP-binding protein, partial [Kofleriaceae bacterium]
SPQELATLRFPDLSVDPAHRERDQFFAVVDGTLDSFKVDKRYRRKDGHIVWGNATVSAVHRDENGRATEMLTVIQDITERKTLELELQAAREAAEAANRAKDQFLAHVSHEIRTPLNAILGMTELALDSDGEHQRQLLRTARSAAGSLLEIVNDLLDFSKIEAGKLSLDVGNFSLRTLLADLVRGILPRTEAKSLSLEYVVADEVPDVLVGDEHRLRQILSNLLANAIKFTPKGSIELQVRAIEVAQHAILAFEVVDTGIGIAPDKQDAIFRAFEQADTTTTRKYGGTGLGLTISAQLAELMGGRIEVSSEVGRGSTFTLTVPFALGVGVSAEPRVDASVVLRTAPPRILVAEDNEMNVAVVREILQKRPHHADYADNGRTALELATRGDYDLLLLDLHMPELDGFEVVRAIRGTPRDRHLPIIALTARSSQKDREEALAAGMDDFLSKPVDVKGLWAGIDRMLAIYPPLERPLDLLDREVIARVSGGRADVLARLVTVFRSTLPGQLARGHVAFDERDFVRLRDAAHRLHGTLGAFSSVAGAVALALEDACARGETHRCRDLLGELDHMSGELLESTLHLSSTP